MFNKTMIWTTIVASLFTLASLKVLHFFNFIKWSPVGWGKKWLFLGSSHEGWKWIVLLIVLLLAFGIFYAAARMAVNVPPSVTAISISIIATLAIEWTILSPGTLWGGLKSISIPFFSTIAIVSRFVTGTAVFMKKNFD
ncbi:hypothetical protein SLU01_25200 [Sporosarcina luteola]|uniref:Uncharacterized protein n=1 Tax=Sporosarcina luteola TaxID=582850 RepID=A0A511Z9V3_9BACL|nr:hypothetical protein [Sporosarcina luteola]GEN84208.1 hypothetical protein SLU01_25200 [Sporosarcina luteola]